MELMINVLNNHVYIYKELLTHSILCKTKSSEIDKLLNYVF